MLHAEIHATPIVTRGWLQRRCITITKLLSELNPELIASEHHYSCRNILQHLLDEDRKRGIISNEC